MTSREHTFWIIVFFTFLSFIFRIINLDTYSLWLDESFTLLRINGDWDHIFKNIVIRQNDIYTVDLNPPLYFALLKAWTQASGQSTFAFRFFSVLCVVPIVALSYVLGRHLTSNRTIGLLSAGLALISPSYQWYASELRPYSLLLFLGSVSSYIFVRLFFQSKFSNTLFILWIISSLLSVFTHYSYISLILIQIILIFTRKELYKYKNFIISLLTLLILLLTLIISTPIWLPTLSRAAQLALQALTAPIRPTAFAFEWLAEIISAFTFGLNAGDPTGTNGPLTTLAGLIIALGLNLGLDKRKRIVLYSIILIPIIFWFILSLLIENRPSFRYIIFIFPFLTICKINAFVQLNAIFKERYLPGLILRVSSAGLIFGSAIFGTAMTFVRTPTRQDDWRALADHLRQNWRPGDALVINLYTPESVLDAYLDGIPIEIIPIHTWLQIPEAEAHHTISLRYQRIWYANTGGDNGLHNPEAQALFSRYLLRSRTAFPARTNIIELLEYDTRPFVSDSLPAQVFPTASEHIGQTHIAGYEIATGNPYHPHPNFWLNLYWRRGREDEDLSHHAIALRLYDAQTNWWDWLISANLTPWPADWKHSKIYRTSHLIPLPLGLPLQPYQLELRVLAGPKGETTQVATVVVDEQTTRCCLRVKQWPGRSKHEQQQLTDAALRAEYPAVLRPNQPLPVVLTWYPAQPHLPAWQTRLKVEGLLGGLVASLERTAGGSVFPVAAWPVGEPTRDPYTLALPPALQPGVYRLSLERWRENRKVDGTLLGLLRVEDYPYVPIAERIQYPSNARVGELQLLGYSANGQPRRGQVNDFITHWRIAETPQRDGVIFLHMLDAHGKLISQDDNPPIVNGLVRSTTTYRPGEGINQLHRLEIPARLSPGQYQLYAGIYDRQSMVRWPAQQDGQPARNDLVFLGIITIE